MRKKIYILLLFLIAIAPSCLVYEPVRIQVLKPSEVILPQGINRVVFVNHSNYIKQQGEYTGLNKNIDSIRTMQYFEGLGNTLISTPRFDVVKAVPFYIIKPSYSERFKKPNWDVLEKICTDSTADAAIVLENYTLTYTDPVQVSFDFSYGYYASFTIENISLWRIYQPSKKLIIHEFLLKDTLYWDASGNSETDIRNQLPQTENAILQSCYLAGEKYGEHIGHIWTPRRRYIMNCEVADFQKAALLARNNQWEEAIEIWKKYPYGKKQRLAAYATYNLAVASETLDHIDLALEWAAKSYFIRNDAFVKIYIETLEERLKEKKKFENQ